MSDNWRRSHWNENRTVPQKTLTVSQAATILFTNDEKRIPLCVIWKEDGKDIFHTRGVTEEFNHSFSGTSISKAVDYVEMLLEQIRDEEL